jgi:hypothetical protein
MLAFVALHAAMGSLKISDAARVYARRSLVDDTAIANIENAPRLDAELTWPTWQAELGYEPRLTFVDVLGSGPSTGLWLHSGAARLSLRQPRYELSITQTALVGEQDFTQFGTTAALAAATQPAATTAQDTATQSAMQPTTAGTAGTAGTGTTGTTPLNLLPNARALRVADEQTAANLRYFWAPRWRSDLRASFGFSGGANAAAQQLLPRQRRAQVDGSLAFEQSRRDQLSTLLMGAQINTSSGYDHWLASASETWSTRWDAASSSLFGAGLAFQDTTDPNGVRTQRWNPIGSASLSHAKLLRDVQVRLQIGIGYSPDLNVLVGRLQNRLQANSTASIATRRMTLSLLLGAAQTIPTSAPDAATIANVAISFDYELLDWLSAQAGGQIVRQNLGSAVTFARATWLLYAGLAARAPELRF